MIDIILVSFHGEISLRSRRKGGLSRLSKVHIRTNYELTTEIDGIVELLQLIQSNLSSLHLRVTSIEQQLKED